MTISILYPFQYPNHKLHFSLLTKIRGGGPVRRNFGGGPVRRNFGGGPVRRNFVEAGGIEPPSEYDVQSASTCLGYFLFSLKLQKQPITAFEPV